MSETPGSRPVPDLERRLAELERRVAELEGSPTVQRTFEPLKPVPVAMPAGIPQIPTSPAPPPPPIIAPVTPPTRPADAPHRRFAPVEAPPGGNDAFERFVGGKLAAWLGAIVVIAGLAIFAKFAFDQGWFGKLTPRGKFTLGAGASLAILLAGELLRGRIGAVPAASLVSAGIGGLYASILAGTSLLGVLGPTGTLVASLVALGIGSLLTLRSGSLAVGFTSLLGGYLAVALTWPFDGREAIVAAYLSLLLAAALGLAIAGPARFRWLRLLEIPHATLALMWSVRVASLELVFAFLALWWAMTVAECSVAALRGRSNRLNATVTLGATSVTLTLAARGMHTGTALEWLPALLAGLAAAGAWQFGGFGRTPAVDGSDDPGEVRIERSITRHGRTLAFAAAGLAAAQAGFSLQGGALAFSWGVMGLLGVMFGVRHGPRSIAVAGVLTLALATVAAAFFWTHAGPTWKASWGAGGELGLVSAAWSIELSGAWWSAIAVAFALLFAARAWTAAADPAKPPVVPSLLASAAALLWTELSFLLLGGYASVAGLLAVPVAATLGGKTPILVKSIGLGWCLFASLLWFLLILQVPGLTTGRADGTLFLAGLVVAAFAFLGARFRGEPWGEMTFAGGLGFGLAALATCLWLDAWYGLERDEPLATALASGGIAVASAIAAIVAARAGLPLVARTGLVGLVLATVAFLTAGSVVGDAIAGMLGTRPWLWNGQNLAGLAILASLVAARGSLTGDDRPRWGDALGALLLATFAVVTSLALWRLFDPAHGPLGGSRGLQEYSQSTWWAILALGLVVLGFRGNRAALRWIGLTALGLVAAKVLLLDMRNAATIWRVVAMLVIGLLLVGTSVIYAKAASRTGRGT
jgi:uncharacterized membrane protein